MIDFLNNFWYFSHS